MIAKPQARLGQTEFVGLMAMLFATIAFSIDGMLPAIPNIGAELAPADPNRAQLIVTSFVLGMGVGTLFTGPLSDTFGRRPVLLSGVALYLIGTVLSILSQTLETLLIARVIMGFGAAGPRVVAMAMVRDVYSGREMARILSFIMVVFTLVPAMAPLMGAAVLSFTGWRGVFFAFVLFALICGSWFYVRQPETLEPDHRRPFKGSALISGVKEVMTHRVAAISTLTQAMVMGILFATISSVQPIFDIAYDAADTFPLWFCGIALVGGTASVVNARIVPRMGMRKVTSATLTLQFISSGFVTLLFANGLVPESAEFWVFAIWLQGIFYMLGLTIGNLNALAMEPMGHLAGLAASVVGAVATVLAVAIAVPIGLAFDGSPIWLMVGAATCAFVGRVLMAMIPKDPVAATQNA